MTNEVLENIDCALESSIGKAEISCVIRDFNEGVLDGFARVVRAESPFMAVSCDAYNYVVCEG